MISIPLSDARGQYANDTGHSYVTYGPLLNAASQVVFEGVPSYPDVGRLWQIVDKYGVSHLYTAPTAIRSLMREGAC